MGAAAMAYVLWTRHLRHDPGATDWIDRDRFVLSAGHGSMLLYALLHLTGYDVTMDDIKSFRQWGSRTPGHPEHGLTPGVETTTGPLGQGFANGVGMALAERFLSAYFNRDGFPIINHNTWGIVSDGDLMEGISHESASLAGHLGLGKLIYLWDDNDVTIDGPAKLSISEDVPARFKAYGWQVLSVAEGNDVDALDRAITAARSDTHRPSLICVKTTIGYGSPNKAGTADSHGSPLGEEEVRLAKKALGGWSPDEHFRVPSAVKSEMSALETGGEQRQRWEGLFHHYRRQFPSLASELEQWMTGENLLPDDLSIEWTAPLATRAASGTVMAELLEHFPNLVGGSADLTPSNKTLGPRQKDFGRHHPDGSYIRFGVREHSMAGISNGMSLHGGVRPYCGTFLVFSDYMRPAIRLSALMEQPVLYVFTHDSIGVGEDGPTHQPVEHVMSLRTIPNLTVIRPADNFETEQAWRVALSNQSGPTALVLTRQKLPLVTGHEMSKGLKRGGYVARMGGQHPAALLIATGSELQLAVKAHEVLGAEGIFTRVISMPSWELFEKQPRDYRETVFPGSITKRLAIEAGTCLGWERYVGLEGAVIGIDHFGASAPGARLFKEFGFTVERVIEAVRTLID